MVNVVSGAVLFLLALIVMYFAMTALDLNVGGLFSDKYILEPWSWGKVKDDSDAATVIGDVSITFPLAMIKALEELNEEGDKHEL